jgi:hypothetical protein
VYKNTNAKIQLVNKRFGSMPKISRVQFGASPSLSTRALSDALNEVSSASRRNSVASTIAPEGYRLEDRQENLLTPFSKKISKYFRAVGDKLNPQQWERFAEGYIGKGNREAVISGYGSQIMLDKIVHEPEGDSASVYGTGKDSINSSTASSNPPAGYQLSAANYVGNHPWLQTRVKIFTRKITDLPITFKRWVAFHQKYTNRDRYTRDRTAELTFNKEQIRVSKPINSRIAGSETPIPPSFKFSTDEDGGIDGMGRQLQHKTYKFNPQTSNHDHIEHWKRIYNQVVPNGEAWVNYDEGIAHTIKPLEH